MGVRSLTPNFATSSQGVLDSKSSVFTERNSSLGPKWPLVTRLLGLPLMGKTL